MIYTLNEQKSWEYLVYCCHQAGLTDEEIDDLSDEQLLQIQDAINENLMNYYENKYGEEYV